MTRFTWLPLVLAIASPVLAGQPPASEPSQFELGRAALQRDPAAAIAHFEQVPTREGREWLAVALMMESRSPSDAFVERAFDAAARSRISEPNRFHPRQEIAATLRPGDLVVAFLVGETAAYAWAFDRDAFLGYQLPPPADLAVSVDRARAYADQHDGDGEKRIADDLLPALFGPALDRLPQLQRVIVVMDGPLQRLPQQILDANDGSAVIVVSDYAGLQDAIARPTPQRPRTTPRLAIVIGALAIAAAALLVSLRARRRSRAPS